MTSKKTGSKPRKTRQRPPVALKIACPSCGAQANMPCILLTAPSLKLPKKGQAADNIAGIMASPAPHASRVTALNAAGATAKRKPR